MYIYAWAVYFHTPSNFRYHLHVRITKGFLNEPQINLYCLNLSLPTTLKFKFLFISVNMGAITPASLLSDIYSLRTDSEASRLAYRYSFLMFQAFLLTVFYFLCMFIPSRPSSASFLRV